MARACGEGFGAEEIPISLLGVREPSGGEYLADFDPIVRLEYTGPGAEPIPEEDLERCDGDRSRAQAVRLCNKLGELAPATIQSYKTYWNHYKSAIDALNQRPEDQGQPLSNMAHPVR